MRTGTAKNQCFCLLPHHEPAVQGSARTDWNALSVLGAYTGSPWTQPGWVNRNCVHHLPPPLAADPGQSGEGDSIDWQACHNRIERMTCDDGNACSVSPVGPAAG